MLASKLPANSQEPYENHVNPQWVRFLDVLDMNVRYKSCLGAELYTEDGRSILDFNSGYCVHNIGHNHPAVIRALKEELDGNGPAMLQGHVPELAGELALRLCTNAGGKLSKVYFCSSGSEGVETVIKFAHAHTKRPGILYASGGFHGLTCGALSLMDNPFWTADFGPLLPDTEPVPFGDLEALKTRLASRRFGAFILEPIQAESGVLVPSADYLQKASELCRRYGTLMVLDEVQTGMFRTGPFLAAHHFGVEPDMVIMAKAMSGGLVPSAAVLMRDPIYDSVFTSFKRSMIHASTYGENGLAMRAGLATLEVLMDGDLGARAERMSERFRENLTSRFQKYDMIKAIRGRGMLSGIEFRAPKKLRLRILFEAFARIHPAMFGQVVVMRLFREGIFSQICGNNFMVLKIAPPLVITEAQLAQFADALERVVDLMHSSTSFWTEALNTARRVINVI
ncbi:MAG TPA: aspartate aminotransferase family protein [Candidatus Binataceae bacterium]|nr:aspartate aminotransferase family protein [Candidatus Binataceae bacterium]